MKSIIVFGGSGLIGTQIKKIFLENSYKVISFDIKQDHDPHPNLVFIKYDLSRISSVGELLSLVEEHMKDCFALINCALLPYPEFNIETFKKVDLTNACSSLLALDFLICSLAVNYSNKKPINEFLSVILTSSVKAIYPPKFRHYKNISNMGSSPFYGSMKAASLLLIKHFASAYRNLNITFNAIVPGGVEGEKHSNLFLEQYRESTSNIGLVDPKYIALSAKYIVESSPSLNGTSICVDAGWSCD